MPLGGSSSCSTFAVSTRKVPSLALVPRGHLQHAPRVKKKIHGNLHSSQSDNHLAQHGGTAAAASRQEEDTTTSKSPPHISRKQPLGDSIRQSTEEQIPLTSPVQQKQLQKVNEDAEGDIHAELRLGGRFLNMMAVMARLAIQPLDDSPAPTSRRPQTPIAERAPSPTSSVVVSSLKLESSGSPVKSLKHVVREVAERLPRALQTQLTFDVCMLLPTPLNDRQSPLRSTIRRKRLRKRGRRRLKRRARRTFQASYTSWPSHASVDYIIDHARQDITTISATRLVERLSERKVPAPNLPRVISMPLPALHQRNSTSVLKSTVSGEEPKNDTEEDEDDIYDQEDSAQQDAGIDVDEPSSQSEEEETTPHIDEAVVIVPSPLREMFEPGFETIADQPRKRPLYHQPAWISPELHEWLVASGLFAAKPRRELLPTDI